MLLTSHIITGAAIASKISNPWLGIPLAFLSHYFLDMIPHDDYSIENIKARRWSRSFFDFAKVFSDIFIGLLLISLFSENNPVIFIGAFSAIIPDGVTLLNKIFPQNKLIIRHQKLHMAVNIIGDRKENKKIPIPLAVFCQIAVIITAISFLRQP